jgi:hypothetical protein
VDGLWKSCDSGSVMRLHVNLFSLPALAVVLVGLVMGLLLIATAFGAHAGAGVDPGAGWMQRLD